MFTTEALAAALAGRYTIDRLVGEGGMAKVYLARDLRHNRQVALKVLRPDLGAVVGVDRFQAEIQVTANLQHPNLLPLFDSGAAGDLLFYVMPFVEGESLRARLDREKQLPVDEAVRLATAIAGALDYAHRKGVVHRDLKPENILIHEGQPLVADFGIALAISNAGGARITQTGLSLGTPQYMSPEQATGDRAIDARTDIYSLGALTYEMLTGEPPHVGATSQAIVARVLTETPRPIRATRPSVPARVEAAIGQALAKIPADRFSTSKEFADALTGARSGAMSEPPTALAVAGASARGRVATFFPWAVAVAGIAVAIASRASSKSTAATPLRLQVEVPDSIGMTVRNGTALALSRDGTQLVFVGRVARSDTLGAGSRARVLYVRRLADDVSLPVRGTETAVSPGFSPDGQSLLFIAGNRGPDGRGLSLRTIPVIGGNPKELAQDIGTSASWGENGEIFFTSARGLEAVSSGGGDRRLVVAATPHRFILKVETLPGARDALVTFATSGVIGPQYNRLAIVSLADGAFTDLQLQGSGPQYAAPGYIVFVRGAGQSFAAPFSRRSRKVTGPPVPLLQEVRGGEAGLAVSQNGLLAYVQGAVPESRVEMLIVDPRSGVRPFPATPDAYQYPRISPDGRRIVAMVGGAAANGVGGVVYVYDAATGRGTRVSPDSNSSRPEWTRDGTRIVFRQTLSDSAVVWSRPWDLSGLPTVIARGGVESFYEISLGAAGGLAAIRNGSAGPSNNVPTSVALAPTESLGVQRALFDHVAAMSGLSVSPNGRFLAYGSNESQRQEVYITPIPGPGRRVQVSLSGGSEPTWSSDGRVLYYRSWNGTRHVGMMAATIAEQPELAVTRRDSLFADVFATTGSRANYDVFPDGRFLMLRTLPATTTPRDRLFVVVNWPRLVESSKASR